MKEVLYGFGGFCADCDETHNHPLHNVIEVIELPDEIVDGDTDPR